MEERKAYIDKVRAQAEECSAEVERLAALAAEASEASKVAYDEHIADLRSKCKVLQEKLQDLEWGKEAWEDLTRGVQNALGTLKEAIDKTRSRFE